MEERKGPEPEPIALSHPGQGPARRRFTMTEESKRYEEMVEAAAQRAPPAIAKWLKKLAPVIAAAATGVNRAAPFFVTLYSTLWTYFNMLPQDLMYACFGLGLCFFGGVYPAAIAAAEAFRMYGWEDTQRNVKQLIKEHQRWQLVNATDNSKDLDGNGVADVDEISGKELFTRKVRLFLMHANPEQMNHAIGGLWSATLGVVGVLKLEFARTVTLGAAIGELCKKTLGLVAAPILVNVLPKEYKQWSPTLIAWLCKVIGMSVAWTIQRIISAWHSAIRGGFMFARQIIKFAYRKMGQEFNDKDSYLDEILGFVVAALGLYTQLKLGFSVPLLIDLVLWPLHIIEWVIQWMVMN